MVHTTLLTLRELGGTGFHVKLRFDISTTHDKNI